jgi:hypothetical protein
VKSSHRIPFADHSIWNWRSSVIEAQRFESPVGSFLGVPTVRSKSSSKQGRGARSDNGVAIGRVITSCNAPQHPTSRLRHSSHADILFQQKNYCTHCARIHAGLNTADISNNAPQRPARMFCSTSSGVPIDAGN